MEAPANPEFRRRGTRLWEGWQQDVGRVGAGVEVRPSDVPDAGNGLWAVWGFEKNQIITYYEGTLLSREEALHVQQTDPRAASHFISLGRHTILDGLRDPQTAIGCGGASFVNTVIKRPDLINARFARKDRDGMEYVVIVATRHINPGEEIYVAYKQSYFQEIHGIERRWLLRTVLISEMQKWATDWAQ